MRWPRRGAGGRLQSLGQDFEAGHRQYVQRMGARDQLWLRTKPFSVPPGHELHECLHIFAHIVEQLGLGVRAQVLDVGCGPGWLCEFLARCGYWVTGVDVSEDMVKIARGRVAAIQEPVGNGFEAVAEFHAMPVLDLPWHERFDAAILYDAMHHLHDEVRTLRVIRRTLAPGGRIFIHEGVRPEPGSEGEEFLLAEMEEYGTLEAPFDPGYLEAVVGKAGFEDVTRFAVLDELVDLAAIEREVQRLEARITNPPMNTVVAVNPAPVGEPAFAARIEPDRAWQLASGDEELALRLTVTNTGRGYWPAVSGAQPKGVVAVGPYAPLEDGGRIEFPRRPLPQSLARGESGAVEIRIPRARVSGLTEIKIDLVREGLAWFEDYGSPPLVVRLPDV